MRFMNLLKKEWVYILISVGVAVLLWFFVLVQENPTRAKTYEDIPVTYVGAEQLEENGLSIKDGLDSIVSSVDVTVEAETNVLQYLTADDITATIDFSDITVAGDYTLNIRARAADGNVSAVSPSKADVTVELLVAKVLPVEVAVTGKDRAYYYGDPVTDTDTVTVYASKTDIEQFTKAVVQLDVDGKTEPVSVSKTVSLCTDDGKIVTAEEFERPLPSVIVSMDIYPTKEVAIDRDALVAGTKGVADGYEIKSVELSSDYITVAAEEDVLDEINSVTLENVDLEGATADREVEVFVEVPIKARAVTPDILTVTYRISQIRSEKTFKNITFEVRNVSPGYKYETDPEKIDVTVSGSPDEIAGITEEDISAYIDLNGLGAGYHDVPVKFDPVENSEADMTSGVLNIAVHIALK